MTEEWIRLVPSNGAQAHSRSLGRIFGKESEYYSDFKNSFKLPGYETEMRLGMAVLQAAWNDYLSGYLASVSALITAEVFDDFLEQAEYLFKQDYYQAAAVIAGAVLEDTLRKMCDANSISLPAKPGLDWMNAELVKKGVYNKLVLKEITFLADLRNKAAHGLWDQFGKTDVENMLKHVREFVTAQMT